MQTRLLRALRLHLPRQIFEAWKIILKLFADPVLNQWKTEINIIQLIQAFSLSKIFKHSQCKNEMSRSFRAFTRPSYSATKGSPEACVVHMFGKVWRPDTTALPFLFPPLKFL